MKNQQELDPILCKKLQVLDPVQPRDSQAAEKSRNRYLMEVKTMVVTSTRLQRLNLWKDNFIQIFKRKERSPMFTTFISIILAFTALLGSGITVVAAQSSQPNEWLYPVKTFSEDAIYLLTPDDMSRFNLNLAYADRRIAEIQSSFANGSIPSDAVIERLRNELQSAFELSVKNAANAEKLLEQIRLRLTEQLRTRLQTRSTDPAGETLRLQIREMLQERIGWAAAGQEQFALLRQQSQNQQQTQNGQQTQQPYTWQATPSYQNQTGGGNASEGGTGSGYGNGGMNFPWEPTYTPMGNQYQYQNGSGVQVHGK